MIVEKLFLFALNAFTCQNILIILQEHSRAKPVSTLYPFISFGAFVMQIKIDVQAGSNF